MCNRGAATILLSFGAQVNTVGITVVDTDAVAGALVTTRKTHRVLVGETGTANTVEPVVVAAEITSSRIAPCETDFTEVIGTHHVEFFLHFIPR